MTDNTLTSEQTKFIEECEEEFKDRYTEKDSDFMKIKTKEPRRPPIVDPWYNKPRRDWSRQNQNQNQNRDRRNHHWDRRNNERNEKLERHAGRHFMHHRQRMY